MTRGSDARPTPGPAPVRPARADPRKVSLRQVSRRRCPGPTVGGLATPQIPINRDIAEVATLGTDKGKQEGVEPYAVDPAQAEHLRAVSAQLTGVDTFTPA
jgi:hypothetical protein